MQTTSKQNYGAEQFTKAWTVAREASIHPPHAFAWRTVPHSMEKTACVQGPVLLTDHINYSQDFTHINKSYLSFLAKNHNIFEPSLLLIKNFHGLIFSCTGITCFCLSQCCIQQKTDQGLVLLQNAITGEIAKLQWKSLQSVPGYSKDTLGCPVTALNIHF